jgi:hypothetical protein
LLSGFLAAVGFFAAVGVFAAAGFLVVAETFVGFAISTKRIGTSAKLTDKAAGLLLDIT